MKELIFDNFHQWKVCFLSGISKALWGVCRIVTCILLGIVSILYHVFRQVQKFCRREPVAAAIAGIIILAISVGWMHTFVTSKATIKHAELQRDSAAFVLDRYLQAYESDMLVVNGDTIRSNKDHTE